MFSTVLIANRGEIACRIIDTLRSMGIRSAAIYSDADAKSRHVSLADVAVRIGPAPAAQSYLSIPAVIEAARAVGAEAIHPGYGFLAENAEFARACDTAGIVFIGPSPSAIDTMGDKISAKTAVSERGVPTVPGIARPGLSDAELLSEAPAIGFPMLIKPSAGGGGKGMHVVTEEAELAAALAAARREAAASFGDDALFIERYLSTPRHIEVQVLADAHGNVIHLGERECSLQRRHQKVIEEAPSPLLDEVTRAAIGEAACETARSVGYRGAGTVEFIVEASRPDEFFFMEMNTRLQVEHPVTEAITGVDLVEQQLLIASGQPLTLSQDDIVLRGHSIEARLYAEDPAAGFLPTGGHVSVVTHPSGAGIRVDTAIESGLDVSIDYDPMLAKIISWGEDRESARTRLVRALDHTAVLGFPTNVEFMRMLLELPEVIAGDLDTGLIARVQDTFSYRTAAAREFIEAALVIEHAKLGSASAQNDASRETRSTALTSETRATAGGPWASRIGWRIGEPAARRHQLRCEGSVQEVRLTGDSVQTTAAVADTHASATLRPLDAHTFSSTIDGVTRTITALAHHTGAGTARATTRVLLAHGGSVFEFEEHRPSHAGDDDAAGAPQLESPMPGTVVLVHAADGTTVAVGDPVIVVEAMKMEHVLRATVAGTVSLRANVGEQVGRGQTLAVIQVDTGSEATEEAS